MSLLDNALGLFVLQATAIIALSRVFGRAAARVGQPLVVAEMMVGILLGPSLLGLLAPSAAAALFPPSSLPALGVVSQVGLILFMFLVGLKLDPKALRGRARASIAISNAGIVVPFAFGALAAWILHPLVGPPSGPLTAFVLFMGVSMSLTAFPVVARILAERRLLGTRVGAIAVACAAADDAAAWCLLAFVVAVARSTGLSGALWTTLFACAFVAVALLVVRPLAARAANAAAEGFRTTPNVMAAVLCLLLMSSWLTEVIGIHSLFGAFAVGAILPKRGGLAAALSAKLEDVVVVFFLPLFFAYSGLRTHIGLLDTATEWLVCAALIGVACVSKLGSATAAARLSGLSWRESSAIGVLMNTRGLMELVVLNIGLDLGVVSPTVFTIMVIMSLVTTLMTTPLLMLLYPASAVPVFARGAPQAEPAAAMTEDYTLLVYVRDEHGPGLATLSRALVDDRSESTVAVQLGDATQHGEGGLPLSLFVARAEELGLVVHPLAFSSRTPDADVRALAEAKEADLVLLAGDPSDDDVMSRAGCLGGAPMTIATLLDRGLRAVRRVLVVCRDPHEEEAVLRLARRLANQANADVTLLHLDDGEPRRNVRQAFTLVELGFRQADGAVYRRARPSEAVAVVEEELRAGYDLVVAADSLAPMLAALLTEQTSLLLVQGSEGPSDAVAAAPLSPRTTAEVACT